MKFGFIFIKTHSSSQTIHISKFYKQFNPAVRKNIKTTNNFFYQNTYKRYTNTYSIKPRIKSLPNQKITKLTIINNMIESLRKKIFLPLLKITQ